MRRPPIVVEFEDTALLLQESLLPPLSLATFLIKDNGGIFLVITVGPIITVGGLVIEAGSSSSLPLLLLLLPPQQLVVVDTADDDLGLLPSSPTTSPLLLEPLMVEITLSDEASSATSDTGWQRTFIATAAESCVIAAAATTTTTVTTMTERQRCNCQNRRRLY